MLTDIIERLMKYVVELIFAVACAAWRLWRHPPRADGPWRVMIFPLLKFLFYPNPVLL